ncbi:MAG: hypothetical protein JNK82_35015 [Myxococcaceae bacterium]|nr:hypothetical protein [Myxococcaceae bacterium]
MAKRALPLVLLTAACAATVGGDESIDHEPADGHAGALGVTSSSAKVCTEAPEPSTAPNDFAPTTTEPPVTFPRGGWLPGGAVAFQAPGSGSLRTSLRVAAPNDTRPVIDLPRGPLTVRVSTQAASPAGAPKTLVQLRAPGLPLSRYLLATSYSVKSDGALDLERVDLIEAATGAVHDSAGGFDDFAPWPLSCEEKAIARFGPIPAGMPSFKWPENDFCSGEKCVQTRFAYLQAVHATWRMTQMMDIIASYPYSAQRSWAWGRSGTDQLGDPVTERTSPQYWFGGYTDERFAVVRELYQDHLNVLRAAEMDGIDLHLRCPGSGQHGCLGTNAHHVVKGYVNICPESWSDLDAAFPANAEQWLTWFDHIVGHELYHHHWVHIDGLGWKMVRDTFTHRHNATCTSLATGQDYSYWGYSPYDKLPRHLATYNNSDGETCGHRNVALRNVDSYNTFARIVGFMVWKKQLWHWPEPAPPTPQPPSCHSDPGCLCDPTGPHDLPDGDYRDDRFCPDLDGTPSVCVETTVNASSTVGICRRCADVRGPGCACNDLEAPCDVGSCWGDDTGGLNSSWGECYVGTPPLWSCLADCDALLNHGECMQEMLAFAQRAVCVPEGTAGPDAANCQQFTGHIDPNTLACTDDPQCGPGAGGVTCAQLGYPPYFVCDASQRCIADP